jgi:hypothetical protein
VLDTHPVVAALQVAVERALEVDWHSVNDAAAMGTCEQLLQVEAQLRAVQCRLLERISATDATVTEAGRTVRSWLVEEQLLNKAEASRRVDVATKLAALPTLAKAFEAGEISGDHAAVIANGVRGLPPEFVPIVETALVDRSADVSPAKLAADIDELRAACGVDDSSDEQSAKKHRSRRFRLTDSFEGTLVADGILTPEVGAKLRLALDAAARANSRPWEPDDGDQRGPAQARHDALGEIADFYLGHADLVDDNGHRPQVVVTVDHDTLAGRIDNAYGRLDPDTPLAPETVRRIGCDAEVIPALLGSRAEVLDIGRATRSWPTAIRRAAWLQQSGRCAFPKCARRLAELHHVEHWAKGGPTALSNAAWLCAFHHWLVHEGGWTLRKNGLQFVFTSPGGSELGATIRAPDA